jgi:hypothetical protein
MSNVKCQMSNVKCQMSNVKASGKATKSLPAPGTGVAAPLTLLSHSDLWCDLARNKITGWQASSLPRLGHLPSSRSVKFKVQPGSAKQDLLFANIVASRGCNVSMKMILRMVQRPSLLSAPFPCFAPRSEIDPLSPISGLDLSPLASPFDSPC